jgi:hypothetical protein
MDSTNTYTVKYYSEKSKWPRIYRNFTCTDDETRNEMFYILSTSRLCTICNDHIIDDSRSTCQDCMIREGLTNGLTVDQIPECPVCYNKMFRVNGTRRKLACGHDLCTACMRRMLKPHHVLYVHPIGGARATCTIMCPLCRATGWYDYSFTILRNSPPER